MMISLDLKKSSEVRKAGDESRYYRIMTYEEFLMYLIPHNYLIIIIILSFRWRVEDHPTCRRR